MDRTENSTNRGSGGSTPIRDVLRLGANQR